ncbi:MAG: Type IV pilus biogenesis and competence protein PilQ precursor [Candidatus Omnitrophica bacterium ADurb.Bin205]|nr:MAG: Type IV pilus biogenesis and competence protein PilQ precursor [Candidatus Omnitrophica bacterium ADurb.Bin205]
MKKNLLLAAFILLFSYSIAQEEGVHDILPPEENNNAMAGEAAMQGAGKISLDLKGVDINELFKVLSSKSGMTIITTPEVKGRVTVFINNLSFDDALEVIVTMQDLAYEKKDNLVKIMTAPEYEKFFGKKFGERKDIKTIQLTYAKPSNVLNVINSLKSDLGKIIADESTGTILIIDTPQATKLMEETIAHLDKPLESAVFNINHARSADIKTFLSELITPGIGQIIMDERNNKAVVTDFPQRLARIKMLMGEFDEQARQVLITGEIIEIQINDKFQRGVDWEKVFSDSLDGLDLVGKFNVSPALSNYGKISMGTLATDKYNVVMDLLSEYGQTRVLNRPRLVVVNREEAKILVGTREAYITQSQSQGEATTITAESVQFIDVGVKLNVVPVIGTDGFITMKIKPEVSSVKDTLETPSGSFIPIVQTTQSETVVKVKDGTTLVIAGLMTTNDEEDIEGIPKLSRNKFFGPLFGKKSKEQIKSELVIFITPTIISGDQQEKREVINE